MRARRGAADFLAHKAHREQAMNGPSIDEARRWFAEGLRCCAHVRHRAVVDAFASVPRERFSGPGPWRVLSPMDLDTYWTTEDADPRRLCHDVLVAIDEARRLNNGQPSLWAFLYDRLAPRAGARVVHVGAGAGYYSAVLAEIVGPAGRVTALEIDPGLAARARENLAPWPQAELVEADGLAYRPDSPADAIVVNAGVSTLPAGWLDGLAEGGRLLVPLTVGWAGGFLLATRPGAATDPWPARHASRTGIIPCVGGHDPEADARLAAALARSDLTAVRSLRRASREPDATCWPAGDGWWLSTEPAGA